MELATALALSLFGGYWFAVTWQFLSFSTRRSDGHHLHFRAALWGVVLFAIAFVLRIWARQKFPWFAEFDKVMVDYIKPLLAKDANARQAELMLVAAYSMALGPLFGGFLNVFTSKKWTLERSLSGMDATLYSAQQIDMPVCVTLTSGKVYVGLVERITDPDRSPMTISLFPMYSGHRDDQGRLELTTDYEKVYRALDEEKKAEKLQLPEPWEQVFTMVIRAESIISATMFSPPILEEFNPDWRQGLIKKKSEKPPWRLRDHILRQSGHH